jgi:T-complex protein 1 subunit delta
LTLGENADLNPISTLTELRNWHDQEEKTTGISVQNSSISNILEERVVQPILISVTILNPTTETPEYSEN